MIEFHAEKIHNVLHVEVVADMNGTDALPLVEKLYLLHNQHSPLVRIGISAIYSDSGTAVPIIPSVCSAWNSITLLVWLNFWNVEPRTKRIVKRVTV